MLFDIGWPELLLIGMIALIVIGPKDLPRALRVAGFWVRKARTLSREFQSSIDQMIREAELDEVREDLKKVTEFDLEKEFQNTVDPTGELAHSIKPPDVPDYFEEPGAAPPPAAAEVPELPAPTETALSDPALLAGETPEPAASDPALLAGETPEPAAPEPGPPEGSPAAPAPDRQPAPKP